MLKKNNDSHPLPSEQNAQAGENLPHHLNTQTQGIKSVHATVESIANVELTPPHPPREETPTYRKSHDYLVHELDTPCYICGVSQSTLATSANRYGATAMETHHYPIERSLVRACDPAKVHGKFPVVVDRATLDSFVDSPLNLLVLCSVHHRSGNSGIHHLLAQDFAILPFLFDGYQVVATPETKDAAIAADDAIEKEHGNE